FHSPKTTHLYGELSERLRPAHWSSNTREAHSFPTRRSSDLRVGAHSQGVRVVAVSRNDVVVVAAGCNRSHSNRFLTYIEVEEAAYFALLVELGGSLFKQADQYHLPVPIQ